MTWWEIAPLLAVVVLALFAGYRWLVTLERRSRDHAERLARIEGRISGDH